MLTMAARKRHPRHSNVRATIKSVTVDHGTDGTRLKLKGDAVYQMHVARKISDDQRDAAEEIRFVWAALGRGLMPRASDPSRPQGSGAADPVSTMRWAEARAWRDHYAPWAAAQGRIIVREADRLRALQLTLDVVVDNYSLDDCDRVYRLRHGTTSNVVRAALQAYAALMRVTR